MQRNRQSDPGTFSLNNKGHTVQQNNRQSGTETVNLEMDRQSCRRTDSQAQRQAVLQWDRQSCSRINSQTLGNVFMPWDRKSCRTTDSQELRQLVLK
jgi:hypothetical protein